MAIITKATFNSQIKPEQPTVPTLSAANRQTQLTFGFQWGGLLFKRFFRFAFVELLNPKLKTLNPRP